MIEKIKEGLFVAGRPGSYRVVYPIKNDLDRPFSFRDNVNWKNFLIGGSWKRLGVLLLTMCVIFFFIGTYKADTENCRQLMRDPCMLCNSTRCMFNWSKVEGANLVYLNDPMKQLQDEFSFPDLKKNKT